MKQNGSSVAAEIVDEHKTARIARNQSATSEDLDRGRY
jgi:hypothetical protein